MEQIISDLGGTLDSCLAVTYFVQHLKSSDFLNFLGVLVLDK